jgi:hypothetical protein
MKAELKRIMLSEIAGEAGDYVDEASPLADTSTEPQIVELIGQQYYIVDGFHRTAGQIRHCRDNDISLERHEISVVVAEGDLVAVAAEPGDGQDEAIAAIYAAAGV